MAARVRHQLVVARLLRLIADATPLGLEVLPDVRLRLDGGPYQRDLVILESDAVAQAAAADTVELPPNSVRLAVEVVSPSSTSDDRAKKPKLYAEAGIPSYIRIELLGPLAPYVYFYKIGKRFYHLAAQAHAGQTIRIDEPVRVEFDPVVLTSVGLPKKVAKH
jgi:Uma2 family endonuclease